MKLGIDLGGSHVAVGLIDDENNVLNKKEENFSLEEKNHIETILIDKIKKNVEELLSENGKDMQETELIGIACPGTISNGVILKAGNLGLIGFNLKEKLQAIWDRKIIIENDGKCAGIAEKVKGELIPYSDAIFLNIGTGIGGAIFLNGKLLKPKACSGFEIGHMVIDKNGIECTCGKKGCFEKYASMRVLKERIRNEYGLGQDVHSRELLEILGNGSELSNKLLDEYLENLKTGLANLIDIFEPEAIVIGGSFAYYEDLFLPGLKEKLFNGNSTFNNRKDIEIKTARLKNDAGIIGAVIENI